MGSGGRSASYGGPIRLSAASFARWHTRTESGRPARLSRGFLLRAGLVPAFAALPHAFQLQWLRFVTSEGVLHLSSLLGLSRVRISLDTISGQGTLFHFVVACTFIDVFMGSIPLLWDRRLGLLGNMRRLSTAAVVLFCFNLVRLEISQMIFALGVPWTFADGILGAAAYFAVWLAIWRTRRWDMWDPRVVSS